MAEINFETWRGKTIRIIAKRKGVSLEEAEYLFKKIATHPRDFFMLGFTPHAYAKNAGK